MSYLSDGVFYMTEAEDYHPCVKCGKVEQTRPYAENWEQICYPCAEEKFEGNLFLQLYLWLYAHDATHLQLGDDVATRIPLAPAYRALKLAGGQH